MRDFSVVQTKLFQFLTKHPDMNPRYAERCVQRNVGSLEDFAVDMARAEARGATNPLFYVASIWAQGRRLNWQEERNGSNNERAGDIGGSGNQRRGQGNSQADAGRAPGGGKAGGNGGRKAGSGAGGGRPGVGKRGQSSIPEDEIPTFLGGTA